MTGLKSLILCTLLVACGKEQGPGPISGPPHDLPTGQNVTLLLFGAPWCTSCKSKLPELQRLLHAQPPSIQSKLAVVFYVTSAASPGEPPTQGVADTYAEYLHLTATALPDPWRWQNFKKFIPGPMTVPAAAVLDAQGKRLRYYTASDTSFVPVEINRFVASQISPTE